jgi:ABC-type branched-subunit amino acid transport system ATPase component/ABC-type branched-subunit amino acid transport system permease subunit
MAGVLQFALLGLGGAAVITLLSSGVVVIYRGSGVVNFAQASFAIAGGYAYFDLQSRGVPTAAAVILAVLVAAAIGMCTELAVMWPMRKSSPLARVVATLALAVVISQVVDIRYGDTPGQVSGFLPTSPVHIGSIATIPQDRIWLLGLAIVVTAALGALYRYTRFGLATSAVAENQDSVAALGWSPRYIAAINWTIGGALAGFAGVLFVVINGVSQDALSVAIVPALCASLVGGFSSFWLTFVGALIVGIGQSEVTRYVSAPGWSTCVPLVIIILILAVRGNALPERSFRLDRLPRVGSGRINPVGLVVTLALAIGSVYLFGASWANAVITTSIAGVVIASLVLLTGYAGQVSLAQYALSGMGALASSRLAAAAGLPFIWALVLGVALTIPLGTLIALPALRARGLNLAVVTLGFAVVFDAAVLSNINYTGGVNGTTLNPPTLFGISFDSMVYPQRYAVLCLVALTAVCVVIANIRRGITGRRLLAVRENERAAASLGISAVNVKVFAFATAAGIAACGGVLAAFQFTYVDFLQYSPLTDMSYLMFAVIGGLGYAVGAINAGVLVTAGAGEVIVQHFFSVTNWWQLILGTLLLVQLVFTPDGISRAQADTIRRIRQRLGWQRPGPRQVLAAPAERSSWHAAPKVLQLTDIVVDFGGNRALNGVCLTVHPGEVVGLIGPNGAGKTTLIDVATGFVKPRSGEIRLADRRIDGLSAQARARGGLSRSWQSQELFIDLTVEENLRAAIDPASFWPYLTDIFRPRRGQVTETLASVVDKFELEPVLASFPEQLPYATRRLVGIGRAVASGPSVLLLDEPAAGLDESSTRELGELIRQLATEWKMGILLVEHDVSLVMNTCDRIVAIDFGSEIASGTPEEVRKNQMVVEAYLGSSRPEEEVDA